MDDLKNKKLTQRETEVLKLVAEGLSNYEIADRLFISFRTVKTHLESIYYKFSVHNKMQAVIYALKKGLLEQPD